MRALILALVVLSAPASADRITDHLNRALVHLRATPGPPERAALLDELERYIARGEFPRRTGDAYPGLRPRFIDDRGVHCAVGYLIARSGQPALARAIADAHEYAYVRDIDSPALVAWAAQHGFNVDELAMIQPEYSPAPTADDVRRQIERAKDRILLACAADHEPLSEVALEIFGKDYRARVMTRSEHPFARCVAAKASELAHGGGAHDEPPRTFQFRMTLKLATPQALLTDLMQRFELPTRCTPRPGALPRTATIEVATSPGGLRVRVATAPHNAEVAACLEADVRRGLAHFAPLRMPLVARKQHRFTSRLTPEAVASAVRGNARVLARTCAPQPTGPVAIGISAKTDDRAFAITVDSPDEHFVACFAKKVQDHLKNAFGVYRTLPDGKSARYFRIDRDVSAKLTIDVSPQHR